MVVAVVLVVIARRRLYMIIVNFVCNFIVVNVVGGGSMIGYRYGRPSRREYRPDESLKVIKFD
ncbi:hypothetical protein BLA29_015519 [Euroglyphus maynei]|uniref:Uncharacterized protein n=1 Tax=Euroglyphus maynei TaxID=6958 RepID=A0A1Y3BAA9_EURMA|nr:hypothetical protein BLA29_015519 [Euroglyphus maynei]